MELSYVILLIRLSVIIQGASVATTMTTMTAMTTAIFTKTTTMTMTSRIPLQRGPLVRYQALARSLSSHGYFLILKNLTLNKTLTNGLNWTP